jgi:TonB family protein
MKRAILAALLSLTCLPSPSLAQNYAGWEPISPAGYRFTEMMAYGDKMEKQLKAVWHPPSESGQALYVMPSADIDLLTPPLWEPPFAQWPYTAITFGVSDAGAIQGATVEQSSGDAQMDKAALEAISNMGDLGRPPVRGLRIRFEFRRTPEQMVNATLLH